ncbi:hypothetical protein PHMEG_00015707 [Phytophthora megakarya]|uniref:Uncharacterized protein n=1 Tax=Phytophthora megakarya TaxID=4795 RepID=A0A225W358_9STRA|nr:hypothetical protein PHMEG_00015707 [Phytophthora megakarya]
MRLEGVDASVVVIHSAANAYDVWKDVNKRYLKAMANFTRSGEHAWARCLEQQDTFTAIWNEEAAREVADSVNALAAAIAPAGPSTMERLMSLHKLIQQVEARMGELQHRGKRDESLQRSLDLYCVKLAKLEKTFFDEV